MNEKNPTVVPPGKPGGKTPAATDAAVAPPAVQPVVVAAPVAQPPAPFGGHRGGGKKRLDGLPAGSAEALEADRRKDRERKAVANAAKKVAALPPPLPGAPAAGHDAAVALAGGAGALPVPVAGVAGAAVAAPLFVPWTQKLLDRPAKLLTKIIDRARCWSLMKHVRKLGLAPEQEKEIAADLKWKEEVVADFNAALSECAAVELNKRRVPGSENSHWINLAMCGGEMVYSHVCALEKIEQMLITKKAQLVEQVKAAEENK